MSTPTSLDDVAFLARSSHRVDVLMTFADGPMGRRDLHEETGISQPTLSRILDPFEERNWIERQDGAYALTPWGELLAEDFRDILDTVETIQRLGDLIRQFPAETFDFDIREFRGATVTVPTTGDAFRHVRRAEELLYDAEHVRNLTPTIAAGRPEDLRAQREKFLSGAQQAEAIVSVDTVEEGMDESYLEFLRPLLESDRAKLYLYEGSVPFMLGIADGTVALSPIDDDGVPSALVEAENEAVREWAERRLDEYQAQSTELTVGDLPD